MHYDETLIKVMSVFNTRSVIENAKIAESSEFEANLYVFVSGTKSLNGAKGVAHHDTSNGMGSICASSRGERKVLIRYVDELNKLTCDPGTGIECKNSEVCTGQVIFILNRLPI